MRFLKRTIQWTIGMICVLYLGLQVAMRIPSVQEWAGGATSSVLKSLLGWDISVGRIRIGLWNRLIIDEINLKDRQDSLMLHASRLAAKLEVLPLLEGRISIANAQLFGTQAYLYQSSPEEKPNFQFIVDTFSSNDTTSTPINLHIGSVLLRRVEVHWDRQWIPVKEAGNGDLNHIFLKDIALTAHVRTIQEDSLNISVKRFSFNENNGFVLKNLSFDLAAGGHGGKLKDFKVQLPNSFIETPVLEAKWQGIPDGDDLKNWLNSLIMHGNLSMLFTPSDLSSFVPAMKAGDEPLRLSAQVFVSDSCLNVPRIDIANDGSFSLEAGVFVRGFTNSPLYICDLRKLEVNSHLQQFITKTLYASEREISPVLTRLDTVSIRGRMQFSEQDQFASLQLRNHAGNISIEAQACKWNHCDVKVKSGGFQLNKLLSDKGIHPLGNVSIDARLSGLLRDANGNPDVKMEALIPQISVQDRDYNDLSILLNHKNSLLTLETSIEDHYGTLTGKLNWKRGAKHRIYGNIAMDRFLAEWLALGNRYPDTRFSIKTDIDISGSTIDDISGELNIADFIMETSDSMSIIAGPLQLSAKTDVDRKRVRTIDIESEPLNLSAQGRFRFSTLATTVMNTLHEQLPNLIPYKNMPFKADTISFMADFQDTVLLRRIALQDITLPERIRISGKMCGYDSIFVDAAIPQLYAGKEYLRNGNVNVSGTLQSLTAKFRTDRLQQGGFVTMSARVKASDNRLRVIAGLDNNRKPRFCGEMDITANFLKDANGKHDVRIWVAPNDFVISDTTWRIHPSRIHWDSQAVSIHEFKVSQSPSRGLEVNGKISNEGHDSLKVNLHRINVGYILDLVNFHSVEFDGHASGTAIATGLLSNPNASANIRVDDFTFNSAPMGVLDAKVQWGDVPNFLSLNASISDPEAGHLSTIQGGFNIGSKEVADGLDLKVNTKNFNLGFINFFTKDIFEDFQGRASGYCRIFGPFDYIDLEGDMMVDHARCGMPMLGTVYHLQQDSVHLRPGQITIDALLMDSHARSYSKSERMAGNLPHTAKFDGRLTFNHFQNLRFEFNAKANKFLGYDFREFGENSFHATCFATGNVAIEGDEGSLKVDIDAMPDEGTTFTYNVTTPEALTEAGFITFTSGGVSDSAAIFSQESDKVNSISANVSPLAETPTTDEGSAVSSDLYINFNLQMTPAAKVRLLMDRKSGDMIELGGRGRIMAKFHNKGRFNIFGTYRVQDGIYKFSLQDIIRKDFKFKPDGTITFGGDPMKADLDLQAVYSVHGVSLDDLTSSSLGFSKTQVDCIMDLTGRPEHPIVTFDFDLPDVTEDERQMIRSIVRTEEERNMQAIYLLGLGRFYNFDAAGDAQSTAAMNSIASSTLSTYLNEFLSNATGTAKWNIGTSIKTGNDGWRNVDVEGMLSGKLFDDRLLVNGNFGYREKYYTQRNFISDVSVEYLLTKNGSISLKAYNQANDRYFVQSSLNTQGIGIQFKRDFNYFSDLFMWLKPKRKQK